MEIFDGLILIEECIQRQVFIMYINIIEKRSNLVLIVCRVIRVLYYKRNRAECE